MNIEGYDNWLEERIELMQEPDLEDLEFEDQLGGIDDLDDRVRAADYQLRERSER